MSSVLSPCHHDMARPHNSVQDGIQMRRLASGILTKQSETAEKRWCSSVGAGRGANNLHCWKLTYYKTSQDVDKSLQNCNRANVKENTVLMETICRDEWENGRRVTLEKWDWIVRTGSVWGEGIYWIKNVSIQSVILCAELSNAVEQMLFAYLDKKAYFSWIRKLI